MTDRVSRRRILQGVAGLAGSAAFAAPAIAQDESIASLIRGQGGGEWQDTFRSSVRNQAAVKSSLPTLSPETSAYVQSAIQRYGHLVQQGGWPIVPSNGPRTMKIGTKHENVSALRQRLIASGDLRQSAGLSTTFDSYVDFAVRRFQERHGVNTDGVVGRLTLSMLNVPAGVRLRQLETNLIRLRSMSGFLGDRYVMVNIPAAAIEAVQDARVRSRHTAVVGKVDRQTPVLSSKIHELNFNPFWHVPVSIIRKDLIPMMKKDPEYLARNKIRIYDWNGNELVKEEIDWNTDEATKYLFRQDPGEINSLGSVKINFHNQHQVYLHDTPSKNLFGKEKRFHSSGCVRVQNVRELIAWILESNGDEWSRMRVDEVIQSGERIDVRVKKPVPLYMSYITAWANQQGVVHFRDDIYGRDGLGLEMFAQN
ncbi:MAG: L,D-transpeptidase family protein [Pseudomonadota bacterium]